MNKELLDKLKRKKEAYRRWKQGQRHGFDGWTTWWIRNRLDVRSPKVAVNGLTSKWRPVTTGFPQGLVLRWVLFNIFVGNRDSGIGCTLSKFVADTKLCVTVGTPEGGDAIQRHLDRLERWACANLMKFNKAKCKVLHVGWGSPKHIYSLGREWIEGSPEEKVLGVLVDELNMTQQCMLRPENQPHPGLHQKKCGQQAKGDDSGPRLHSGETLPGVLHPAQEGCGPAGASSEEGHEDDQRAGAPLL
ncbi:rna-directed dna polymerase from mobile element jockey-like [Limosa lapponica baueri]|uniref:Rna-directed dna polymerase from mobile element jockey-like n=1 Tax=Limosa lapponica baueri TaxID=1758121 RepID=A0A2I0UPP6_LIMLA|nr:rna-directed dna polymerase from mobile element jockey-like [Limosa lapponica baueri]